MYDGLCATILGMVTERLARSCGKILTQKTCQYSNNCNSMSFVLAPYVQPTTVPIQEIDTRHSYREITKEFCIQYYTMYDSSFMNLANFYAPDSCFTYLDEEIVGFYGLVQRLRQYGIWKFTHHHVNVNSQPLSSSAVLITVTGTISVNNSVLHNRFSETMVLQRMNANKFYVVNTMFRLIE